MHFLAKRAAGSMNRLAASNPSLASAWLRLFRAMKAMPDGPWKRFVLNSLAGTQWPEIDISPARVRVANADLTIVPHVDEFDFAAHVYRRLPYEAGFTNWLAGRSYDAVLEIGANVGIFSLLFSKLWPNAAIYSFEPSRRAYARLLRHLALNDCRNVYPFNCAVGSVTGFADFFEPAGHLTNGSLHRDFAELFSEAIFSTKTLILSGSDLRPLIANRARVLIKIDVEGAEPEVVKGLESIIEAQAPDIVLEVLDRTEDELNRIGFLRETYGMVQLHSKGLIPRESFVAGEARDYALTPRRTRTS